VIVLGFLFQEPIIMAKGLGGNRVLYPMVKAIKKIILKLITKFLEINFAKQICMDKKTLAKYS